MVSTFRSQQSEILPVESDPIEMSEIRVFAFLAPETEEIEHAIFFIHAQQLRDHPVAGSDLVFQLARREIVEIQGVPNCRARKTK